MTLEKAIEILQNGVELESFKTAPAFNEACRLGIEALKRTQARRERLSWKFEPLLPGETEDYCKFCGLAHTGIECPDRGGEK